MRNSNRNKAEFLGMPYGTASNRLRKRILFMLIQDSKNDTCFRCGRKIEIVAELSIEHKKPWLGVDVELFWDLDNIAFSHLSCNSKHHKKVNKIVPPKGMGWCSICETIKPLSEFPSEEERYSGGDRKPCSECAVSRNREYRNRQGSKRGKGWRKS